MPSTCKAPFCNELEEDVGRGVSSETNEEKEKEAAVMGSRTLSSLHFSLRDHSGNLIPLEDGYEWSAQIQFGFPEK